MRRNLSRRSFLKGISMFGVNWNLMKGTSRLEIVPPLLQSNAITVQGKSGKYKPIEPNGKSRVFLARGRTPADNLKCMVDAMGGIETLIGKNDVVLIKPNGQWWNQGMSNTDTICALVELIINRSGFSGEVVIGENHHFREEESRGWTTNTPNGRWNLNDLVSYFNARGHPNVSKVHWRDAGSNPRPLQGDAGGGKRTHEKSDGDGYVWDSSRIYKSPQGRKCMMTYPVFTSPYSGVRVSLLTGVEKRAQEPTRSLSFLNVSSLNHHSSYCGVTASIKNLMGIVDMTCGYPGPEPPDYWSTHYIGMESTLFKASETSRNLLYKFGINSPSLHRRLRSVGTFDFRYTGGALGYWIYNVRRPTMNFITADWVGWGSRTDASMSSRPRALLASLDPVALDYVAARDVLLPETEKATRDAYFRRLNNPDNDPLHGFLEECRREAGGNLDSSRIEVCNV